MITWAQATGLRPGDVLLFRGGTRYLVVADVRPYVGWARASRGDYEPLSPLETVEYAHPAVACWWKDPADVLRDRGASTPFTAWLRNIERIVDQGYGDLEIGPDNLD